MLDMELQISCKQINRNGNMLTEMFYNGLFYFMLLIATVPIAFSILIHNFMEYIIFLNCTGV